MKLIDLLNENYSSTDAVTVKLEPRPEPKQEPVENALKEFKGEVKTSPETKAEKIKEIFWQGAKEFDIKWNELLEKEEKSIKKYHADWEKSSEKHKKEFSYLHSLKNLNKEVLDYEREIRRTVKNEKLLKIRQEIARMDRVLDRLVSLVPKSLADKNFEKRYNELKNLEEKIRKEWKDKYPHR